MQISELMSVDLVTVSPKTTIHDALDQLDRNDVRHLPVLEGGRLVGILSDRDLYFEVEEDGARPVSELMHTSVQTLEPESGVVAAALEMSLQKIGCLPVVKDGHLLGLLTEVDLMAAFRDLCGGVEHLDQNPSVETRMTREVKTVTPETTLRQAAELLRELDVRHLPIVADGKLASVISDRDLRLAHGQHLAPDTPLSQVMVPRTIVVAPEARLHHAAKLMVEHRISCLPVCEGLGHHLVGILTSTDLLDHCMDNLREDE